MATRLRAPEVAAGPRPWLSQPLRLLADRTYSEYAWAYFFIAPSVLFFACFMAM